MSKSNSTNRHTGRFTARCLAARCVSSSHAMHWYSSPRLWRWAFPMRNQPHQAALALCNQALLAIRQSLPPWGKSEAAIDGPAAARDHSGWECGRTAGTESMDAATSTQSAEHQRINIGRWDQKGDGTRLSQRDSDDAVRNRIWIGLSLSALFLSRLQTLVRDVARALPPNRIRQRTAKRTIARKRRRILRRRQIL